MSSFFSAPFPLRAIGTPARARRGGVPVRAWRRSSTWVGLGVIPLLACQPRAEGSGPASPSAEPSQRGVAEGERVAKGEASIEVDFRGPDAQRAAVFAWVSRARRAIEGFYGHFPVSELLIQLRSASGAGLRHGRVVARERPVISMTVGTAAGHGHFARDWRLTHEMVHLALPRLPERYHWLEEGLATYVEPIARARAGWLSEEEVWLEWLDGMPLGRRQPRDGGLDGTRKWSRTYWGGAAFCLSVDVELRRRSDNRRGLPDALRGIVADGGNFNRTWPLSRVLASGDRATGYGVLLERHRELGARSGDLDLAGLFRDLGVRRDGDRVRYDDDAPLSSLRRALVTGRTTADPPPPPRPRHLAAGWLQLEKPGGFGGDH